MVAKINEGYLGNNLVKRAGVETQYTPEELQEYIKCGSRSSTLYRILLFYYITRRRSCQI